MTEETSKCEDTDSPTPMVIDESGSDVCQSDKPSVPSELSSSSRNHPNYEPLTDEET